MYNNIIRNIYLQVERNYFWSHVGYCSPPLETDVLGILEEKFTTAKPMYCICYSGTIQFLTETSIETTILLFSKSGKPKVWRGSGRVFLQVDLDDEHQRHSGKTHSNSIQTHTC